MSLREKLPNRKLPKTWIHPHRCSNTGILHMKRTILSGVAAFVLSLGATVTVAQACDLVVSAGGPKTSSVYTNYYAPKWVEALKKRGLTACIVQSAGTSMNMDRVRDQKLEGTLVDMEGKPIVIQPGTPVIGLAQVATVQVKMGQGGYDNVRAFGSYGLEAVLIAVRKNLPDNFNSLMNDSASYTFQTGGAGSGTKDFVDHLASLKGANDDKKFGNIIRLNDNYNGGDVALMAQGFFNGIVKVQTADPSSEFIKAVIADHETKFMEFADLGLARFKLDGQPIYTSCEVPLKLNVVGQVDKTVKTMCTPVTMLISMNMDRKVLAKVAEVSRSGEVVPPSFGLDKLMNLAGSWKDKAIMYGSTAMAELTSKLWPSSFLSLTTYEVILKK